MVWQSLTKLRAEVESGSRRFEKKNTPSYQSFCLKIMWKVGFKCLVPSEENNILGGSVWKLRMSKNFWDLEIVQRLYRGAAVRAKSMPVSHLHPHLHFQQSYSPGRKTCPYLKKDFAWNFSIGLFDQQVMLYFRLRSNLLDFVCVCRCV